MSTSRPRILLVDDEPNLRKVLGALLTQEGFEVHAEADGEAALARVRASPSGTFDAVISDLRMPKLDGIGLLRALVHEDHELPVVLLTAHGTVDSAVEAVKLGAFDYLEKPFDRDQIRAVLQRATATRARSGASLGPGVSTKPAEDEKPQRSGDPSLEVGMIGASAAVHTVREIVRTAAASPSTVLITGESGTGKELVARALHLGSPRRNGPFIRVNCAAIPAGLTESELFGHERGAFTGAVSSRAGRFELADGGTLFLDEVTEIPLEIQVKLLRAIQESEFERVGGVKTLHVDVRIIAASNRDIEADVKSRRFREDLYYRLNVVPIQLPPLRDRLGDLPALIEHFVVRCNDRLGKQVRGFSDDALSALSRYGWPGNIRELENLVERMVLFASGQVIDLEALPDTFLEAASADDDRERAGDDKGEPIAPVGDDASAVAAGTASDKLLRLPLASLGFDLKEAVRAGSRMVEEALIREALTQTQYNVTRSARLLGISRRSLQSKMKELGLRTGGDDGRSA
ncbi:MAG TPA: sigma-54 dependent transcriptional regulator [Nannocystaceae bacterium]|nr:sigma-54 dependent transcriptional regulator [Nannocystaceae bacterium]